MSLPLLDPKSALDTLREDLVYTEARLAGHPLTGPFAPEVAALIVELDALIVKERTMHDGVLRAGVRAECADDGLDCDVDDVERVLDRIVKGNHGDPLFLLFFGTKPPSRFKRPVLAGQLVVMQTWPGLARQSGDAELMALGTQLEPKLVAAARVEEDEQQQSQALKVFRTVGERPLFVEKANAARKVLHGKLGELRAKHPDARLANTFADGFFRHAKRAAATDDDPSAQELRAQIALTEVELATRRQQLDARLARDLKDEALRKERETALAELEAARKVAADAAAKVAALEAKAK